MNKYKKRIDESIYLGFGKMLSQEGTNKQVLDNQIEFLQACRSGKDDFLGYLEENLLNESDAIIDGKDVFLNHRFTEKEFRSPPVETQQIIWDTFNEIPRENMTLCGFWGRVVINMIKDDCIKPEFLASNLNGVNETGIYMIDKAIESNDGKTIDTCVRRILRSMGCPPAGRGKRIVFNDFYLGKAYWRWNWAYKMSNEINLNSDEILDTLSEKGYAAFSERMFSSRSYISHINIFGGFLLFLNKNPSTLVENTKKIINRISYLSVWKAIEVQSPELNQQEIEIIANNL